LNIQAVRSFGRDSLCTELTDLVFKLPSSCHLKAPLFTLWKEGPFFAIASWIRTQYSSLETRRDRMKKSLGTLTLVALAMSGMLGCDKNGEGNTATSEGSAGGSDLGSNQSGRAINGEWKLSIPGTQQSELAVEYRYIITDNTLTQKTSCKYKGKSVMVSVMGDATITDNEITYTGEKQTQAEPMADDFDCVASLEPGTLQYKISGNSLTFSSDTAEYATFTRVK
jgi:hypothetical protein